MVSYKDEEFQNEELSHELLVNKPKRKQSEKTKRKQQPAKKTKTRNAFSNIIQSDWFLSNMIENLGKKTLLNLVVLLPKDVSPKLVTKAILSAIDKFERTINGRGAVRAEKVLPLFISNKDLDKYIRIVKSLEKLGLLIDGANKTVKHEK